MSTRFKNPEFYSSVVYYRDALFCFTPEFWLSKLPFSLKISILLNLALGKRFASSSWPYALLCIANFETKLRKIFKIFLEHN